MDEIELAALIDVRGEAFAFFVQQRQESISRYRPPGYGGVKKEKLRRGATHLQKALHALPVEISTAHDAMKTALKRLPDLAAPPTLIADAQLALEALEADVVKLHEMSFSKISVYSTKAYHDIVERAATWSVIEDTYRTEHRRQARELEAFRQKTVEGLFSD